MALNLEKYKEAARKYELKEQWAKALEEYAKAIEEMEAAPDSPDADLNLYNKAGDLAQRVGSAQNAVAYYERAVDKYFETGFHNNAIALCNKVLRLAPGRAQTYLKLGMLFASKGFAAEAQTNLLEYADRMQKAGQLEEAFKALKAFAEMTPGQEEIWAVLAQQARAFARTPAQKEQVEQLLAEFEARDQVVQRRRSRMSRHQITGETIREERGPKKGELVFLDLDEPPAPRKSAAARAPAPAPRQAPPAPRKTPPPPRKAPAAARKAAPPPPPPPPPQEPVEPPPLEIQQTSLAVEEEAPPAELPPLEIQSTSLAEEMAAPPADAGLVLEPTSFAEAEPPAAAPPEEAAAVGELELETPEIEAPAEPELVAEPEAIAEPEVAAEPEALEAEPAAAEGLPLLDMEEGAAELEPLAPAEATAELDFLDVADLVAAPSLEDLETRIQADAADWEAHRLMGEALIEQGDRERGLEELDVAIEGLEAAEELDAAYTIAEEALRLEPNSVRHHQKRVELAYRQGDKSRLADAYLELADALLRSGDADKALAVYQRVLEHDPLNTRAKSAVDTLAPAPTKAGPPGRRARKAEPVSLETAGGTFVDLGAMLLEEEERPKDTRMRIEDEEPSGDEQKDFAAMLSAFKRGVEENVEESDFQSHYDLGVAYKEMGLVDEAIAEFQKALRGADGRLKSSEALGLCFYEKGQFTVAETILRRALELPASGDAERVGLLYWLGRALEEQTRTSDALIFYNRVFAVDITFQDVSQRVKALSSAGV